MDKQRSRSPAHRPLDDALAVDRFVDTLIHPHKDAIVDLRSIILAAAPGIAEGIKWNVPSFRTTDNFATMHLRMKAGIGLILHFGARASAIARTGVDIADPEGMLVWIAKDRALMSFADRSDVLARRAGIGTVLREWITHLPQV